MVNMPFAKAAAELSKEKHFFDKVGLHINLTEGKALSDECASSVLCDENGYFLGTFHVPFKSRLYLPKCVRRAIRTEVEAQIKKYIDMGFTLMHADSHNYTHSYFSVYSEVGKLLKKYNFKSTRISRNISSDGFSLPFKVYKEVFNRLIQNLKTSNGNKIRTNKYFGSVQDFESNCNKDEIRNDLELMTHPDFIDGVLTDNTLPSPHPFVTSEWIKENVLFLNDVSEKKIKMLIAFIQVHTGGAMTSLVNFLNALDTDKYDVDVIFYENDRGRCGIKDEINILPQGKMHEAFSVGNLIKKSVSPSYVFARIQDLYYKKVKHNKRKAVQIMSKQGCRYSRALDKEYDIAIAYEFTWALNYVTYRVKAKKKILWHHVEYEKSGMDYKVDKKAMNLADALVFVSEDCKKGYIERHPEHKDKCFFVPNLLSSEYVRAKGEEEISLPFEDNNYLKFVTTARISFEHKGLDRAAMAFSRLKKDGLLENVKWIIIGKGRDMDALEEIIRKEGLDKHVYPIGLRENPIPYLKACDIFLLPSRHEGKPMAVTEGFIMGLVPVVTEYTSAKEQIRNGVDGLVFDNNDEALYEGLKRLLENPGIINELKKNVTATDYGNEKEIRGFD
jgi:glycosyltransferase involved in cell wall biosynthesis/predicted glycoside hydrolase/deacetylase ChbG (UPF0249 family)